VDVIVYHGVTELKGGNLQTRSEPGHFGFRNQGCITVGVELADLVAAVPDQEIAFLPLVAADQVFIAFFLDVQGCLTIPPCLCFNQPSTVQLVY
jgi:hypothetical protein